MEVVVPSRAAERFAALETSRQAIAGQMQQLAAGLIIAAGADPDATWTYEAAGGLLRRSESPENVAP